MKTALVLLCFISLQLFSQNTIKEALDQYNKHSVSYISVEELYEKLSLKAPIYLLDAREKSEYEVSHLQNAIWVGYSKLNLEAVENINKSSTLIVYCSIGVRSEQVGEKLNEMGFKNIYNLHGGIFEWVNSSLPIYDMTNTKTKKVHAFDAYWAKLLTKGEKVFE